MRDARWLESMKYAQDNVGSRAKNELSSLWYYLHCTCAYYASRTVVKCSETELWFESVKWDEITDNSLTKTIYAPKKAWFFYSSVSALSLMSARPSPLRQRCISPLFQIPPYFGKKFQTPWKIFSILPILKTFPDFHPPFAILVPSPYFKLPPNFREIYVFFCIRYVFFVSPPSLTMMHLCITQCKYRTLLHTFPVVSVFVPLLQVYCWGDWTSARVLRILEAQIHPTIHGPFLSTSSTHLPTYMYLQTNL